MIRQHCRKLRESKKVLLSKRWKDYVNGAGRAGRAAVSVRGVGDVKGLRLESGLRTSSQVVLFITMLHLFFQFLHLSTIDKSVNLVYLVKEYSELALS